MPDRPFADLWEALHLSYRIAISGTWTGKRLLTLTQNCAAFMRRSVRAGPAPTFLMIEPTNHCNLDCLFCPAGKNTLMPDPAPKGILDPGLYRSIIDECHPYTLFLLLYFMGEPYLHKGLHEMIAYASAKGLNVRLSTNGHFFADDETAQKTIASGLDTVIISISGGSQGSYEKFHIGGDFRRVVQGARNLIRLRKKTGSRTPRVHLRCLMTADNLRDLDETRRMIREIGADCVEFKPVVADSKERAFRHSLIQDQHGWRASDPENLPPVRTRLCNFPWLYLVVRWNGEIMPCCECILVFPRLPPRLGQVNGKAGVLQMWNGEAYLSLRRKMLKNISGIEMCRHCHAPGVLDRSRV